TSSIGPRPISGVPVNSNVRMTSSYSTASSAGNPFVHPAAEVVKQTSYPVSAGNAPRYVAPNSDISPGKDMYSLYNGQPVNPTLNTGQIQQYRSQGY
ncbi:IncHI-type conjugal transfer lipoprotein TrhV, partial [Escherichia coli]